MNSNKKVVALIPARGGSKGLPGKNVRSLNGKPLIAWSIELAKGCRLIDKVVVSTDSQEIADISSSYGADVPFLRPPELATDKASSKSVVEHCIATLDESYDILVLLQPTSPLRTLETLEACILSCAESAKTVISVSQSKKPVEWMFYRRSSGFDYVLDGIDKPTRRQDCKSVHYVDGSVYCFPISTFFESEDLFNQDSLTVVSRADESIDIDTIEDFQYCEFLIKEKC